MSKEKSKTKIGRKKQSAPLVPTAQYSFGFLESAQLPSITISATETILEGEVALPSDLKAEADVTARVAEELAEQAKYSLPLSDGALERAYFLQQSSKYDDRLFKAVIALITSVVLCIFVKGGIAISKTFLDSLGVATDNLHIIAGILGAATLMFGGAVCYFLLRANEYVPQKELHFPQRRMIVGALANIFLLAGSFFLIAGFLIAVWQTRWDMVYLVQWIRDHIIFVLDGWDVHSQALRPKH